MLRDRLLSNTIIGSMMEKADSRVSAVQAPEYGAEKGIPVLVIRPSRGWSALNLADLWHYRELIYFLTWRDIKVRYKRPDLGIALGTVRFLPLHEAWATVFSGEK